MTATSAQAKVPRLADIVFDALMEDILGGSFGVGSVLPAERVLAERFGVSRLIVRQAIHRLADIGLVRSRQGGGTVVLGRDSADALALLPHLYRVGEQDHRRFVDAAEHQYGNGLRLLDIAERRATDEALQSLVDNVTAEGDGPHDEDSSIEFNRRFWTAVAEAGGNQVAIAELKWWYRSFSDLDKQTWRQAGIPGDVRYQFFLRLAARLCGRNDAASMWKAAAGPIIARMISEAAPRQDDT